MRRLVFASLLVLGFAGPALAATTPEPRVALVIGNSAYPDAPLANPVNDARLIAETLRGLGFEVIERTDIDQRTMKRAIVEFSDWLDQAGKDAVGLFFYAGHGVQVNGRNYLVPLNAEIERESHVDIEAVSAGWVLGEMEVAGNRMNFVILDACRNNPLMRRFRSPARGLARMDAPRGSLVAYSTAPGQVARDGAGANSPYSLALARAMRTSGVPVEKMFKQVRDTVMAETKGEQVPWEESSLTGKDFYFKSPQVAAAPLAAISGPAQATLRAEEMGTERLFWESIKDGTNPLMFEAYLEEFPEGTFARLAKLKRDALAKAAEEAKRKAAEDAAREAESEVERAFWETVKDSDDPAEYETFLAAYPNGKFAALARNRLKKLQETQTAAVVPPPKPAPAGEAVQPVVGVYPKRPGETFKDCEICPEMVVIPPGTFRMGDIAGTGKSTERPVHTVTISTSFAMGKYEVTFEEYDRFVEATGRSKRNDYGWGRGRRPTIKVPWEDAVAYTEWLSKQTGQHYRLPSEAEWEYAARAGAETKFWWGNTASHDYANYGTGFGGWFPSGLASGKDQWVHTAPVGSFSPNRFGLYDMNGNVWEHVQDCWHDKYVGAPRDGSPWLSDNCGLRVMRSGSWGYNPVFMRSASRVKAFWGVKAFLFYGFRVARMLVE